MSTLPADFYTPARILKVAAMDAGKLQRGDELDSDQISEYLGRLNELILAAQVDGIKLWLQLLLTLQFVAGQAKYVIAPGGDVNITKPTRIIEGYYLDNTGNQRPLIPLAWNDWNRLSNKNQLGQPNSYFVDKQALQLNVSFWLVPDAIAALATAQLLVQQQQPTVAALNETMIFPPEWGLWLHWGLADQLATGAPKAVQDRCEKRAMSSFSALSDWDVEDAPTFFQADSRMGTGSSFK